MKHLWQLFRQFVALHHQHNGFSVLQRYYERHFTPVGKALLLLGMISLSLGMVGTEVLIYIFLCCLAGLWCGTAIVGWLSRPRKITVAVNWPRRAQAGQAAVFELVFANTGRAPVFHLQSELLLTAPGQSPQRLFQGEEIFCLEPGERVTVAFAWTPPARGAWQLSEVQLISLFPLGLALWRTRLRRRDVCWVFPCLLPFAEAPWRLHQPQLMQAASQATLLRGESLDFQGIRPWLPGDSPRYIHWPSLARTGQLALREYQESQGHQIALLLPTAPGNDPLAFETAVGLMAGLIHQILQQPFHQLLLTQIGEQLSLASQSLMGEEALLMQLARVQAREACPLERIWDAMMQLPVPPTLLICVTAHWDPALEQLQRLSQQHRWPLELYAVGPASAFPANAHCLEPLSVPVNPTLNPTVNP